MTEKFGMQSRSGDLPVLKGIDVRGRIAGLLAVTTVVQRYENLTGTNLEVTYTFPLPVDAVLLNFKVSVGERHFAGEVVPRSQAEEKYEQAVEAGNTAFRLQSLGKGLYSATLGNVLAGEVVRLELEYAEALAWNGEGIRYRLPTTLAPRYGEPKKLKPWQRPQSSLTAQYSLDASVELTGELTRSTVSSPSHRIRLAAEPGLLRVSLASTGSMDRDFILDVSANDVQSLGVTASALDAHVAMVTFLPPEVEPTPGRNALILLDCSGSMNGDSIRLAKEGVQLALGHLEPEDKFGVIGFGSKYVELAPALQLAENRAITRARRFVEDLGDLGGTELTAALDAALAYATEQPLDILLLTDGEAWNIEGSIEVARERDVRIFTVGIGAAVAEDTVSILADETGGACELVSPNEEMSARIERQFKRMRQPRIQDVDLAWPRTPLWVTHSERATFAGDAHTVFAAFDQAVSGDILATITYPAPNDAQTTRISLSPCPVDLASSIVRVAAASRLPSLAASAQTEWAVRYQLLTENTDYIVTMARAAEERPTDLPELHQVPHMLAAGWSGTGTVLQQRFTSGAGFSDFDDSLCLSVAEPLPSFDWEVPAVIRRKTSATPVPVRPATQLTDFLDRLERRVERRGSAPLPLTRLDMVQAHLPDKLLAIFDEIVAGGTREEDAARALYLAMLLAVNLSTRVEAAVGELLQGGIDKDLGARYVPTLDALRDGAAASPVHAERYDIPAFLRKKAD